MPGNRERCGKINREDAASAAAEKTKATAVMQKVLSSISLRFFLIRFMNSLQLKAVSIVNMWWVQAAIAKFVRLG